MRGVREPVAEIVDVLVVAPETVGLVDVVEVLELEAEPVMVELTEEVFDERADREAAFVRVGFAVVDVVDVVVGLSVCCRVERTVRVSVDERRGVAVVVLVWATLRAGGPLLVSVGDAVVVLELETEPVLVPDSLGVVVVFSDPEWVVDALVVLLPGGDLVYVAHAVAVLVGWIVRVVVLLCLLETDIVAELVVVLDLVAVRLPLGDDVAVLEVVTDPVLVGVVRIDPDRRVVLENDGDADDVLEACEDRDKVGLADAVLDLAPECVPVGEREAVLVMEAEPVTVLDPVVVFVAVAVPVVVREPRSDRVRRGLLLAVLDIVEDLVDVLDVVMVLVEEGLGVCSCVGFAVRVKVVLLVEVLLCVVVEVAATPLMSRLRPLSGSTVETCSGGPTTSWILSAALNVANRIKLAENRFILP